LETTLLDVFPFVLKS